MFSRAAFRPLRWLVWAGLTLFALAGTAFAQQSDSTKDAAPEALTLFQKEAVGVWALVTPRFSRRVPATQLNEAAERCAKPPTLTPALASGLKALQTSQVFVSGKLRASFRGDLAYLRDGKRLIRIDYIDKSVAQVAGVGMRTNAQDKRIFHVKVARARFAVLFDGFNIAKTDNGFMVQGSSLYLKCPNLP